MSFKALAKIKVLPDGTITGELLDDPEIQGITLIPNGVYVVGYDDWSDKVAIVFEGKDNES